MDELNDLRALDLQLEGNEILVLSDPDSMWVVETGSVGLFGVALRDGKPDGPRRYFFTCRPGDAMYGLPRVEDATDPSIVAVALEDSKLRRLALAQVGQSPATAELARKWVEGWQRCLGALDATGPEAPAPDGPAVEGGRPSPTFHRHLLRRVHELDRQEGRDDRTRLEERERRSRQATQEAIGQLTSVLEPGITGLPQGTEVFVAAYAVAGALGIQLLPPATWEEPEGASEHVEAIARASHVRVRQILLHDSWWKQDCGPILAFNREGHKPVALLPATAESYRILDPATRVRRPVDEAVAAELEPEAYVFSRPLPERATSAVELLKFALHGRGRDLGLILATGVAATLLGMFTPQATALLVDHAIPDADRALLVQLGLGLGAAAFGMAVFRLAQGIAMMRLETGADAATQSAVWDRLLNLQLSFFRRFSTGDLQSRVTAISQIRSYLGGTTMRTLFGSVILLLNFGLLLYYSPTLTVVAVGVALVSCVVTVASGALILRYSRQILELKGRFFGLMVQLINGVAKLRVAAAEERAFARWASEYARLLKLELRQRKIQDSVQVINVGLSTLSAIVLFAAAATLIGDTPGGLTTGVFLAFSVAYGTFIGAIVNLSNTVTDVMAIAILRERARPILEASPEVSTRKTDPGHIAGRLELEHIVFQYQGDGPIILDDVSLRVLPGQFVALVGPSGSGKSTLLRLLLGFESPQSGAIYYDRQDLSGIDVHAVRRQMGVVLQNGRINAGSLFDNIACGTRVTLNDAWAAARATGFADEIEAMPMGMHTVISEGGTNLSGGQRQRLLLTRALVHKPSVLLLDEATSALDNQTQAIVSKSLEKLRVTRVVIAHRLSTIRNADRIYVIDAGRIIQEGSFAELARQEGLFARLMARQQA